MPRRGVTGRRWCFTLNNYTEEDIVSIRGLIENDVVSFIITGKEVGNSGTPHLQGYLELTRKKTLVGVKSLIGIIRIHLEKARGTPVENIEYCSKEGNVIIRDGDPMRQGKRSDLEEVKLAIDSGASEIEIADNHFSKWVQYRRSFAAYRNLRMGRRSWKSIVVVIHGPTGVGKTRWVHEQPDDRELYVWGGDRWFDGYQGHPIVLLDDFDGAGLEFRFLLRLLDRYPMQVPVKGGFVEWLPKKIYITSNLDPRVWTFPESTALNLAPLLRRLDRVIHMQ